MTPWPQLAHHEESETIRDDIGWRNVYGRRIKGKAGQPLPLRYGFEQLGYNDESNAVAAAILRSIWHGMGADFTRMPPPGRRQ